MPASAASAVGSRRPVRPERRRSWWARRSLRARLTAAAGLVIAVGMVAAAGLLVWRLHSSLIAALDATLTQQAQAVAAQAEEGHLPRPLRDSGDDAPVVQVVAADGRVVTASPGVEHAGRLFATRGGKDATLATASPADTGDGEEGLQQASYRVAAVRTDTPKGAVTVYAALPTDPVTRSTTELVSALAVGVPVLVAALVLVGWLLVGRALRPVEALRRQAAAIPGTDLHARLRLPAARDELGRLAATLNELLTRIEAASSRQRQFVADAAHELRSPIATLRAQLEVAARNPDPAATASVLPGLLGDTERLSELVDDLLALARLDAQPAPHRQVVDLDEIVMEQARRVRAQGRVIDTSGVSAGRVLGDPAGLERVVRNLLDNAARHATRTVQVRLGASRPGVVLLVADDGAGIAAADRERVFDRFTRLDDARSRDAGGAGLGLAIVRDVVLSHGGTVRLEDNHPGARFTITLPIAP